MLCSIKKYIGKWDKVNAYECFGFGFCKGVICEINGVHYLYAPAKCSSMYVCCPCTRHTQYVPYRVQLKLCNCKVPKTTPVVNAAVG